MDVAVMDRIRKEEGTSSLECFPKKYMSLLPRKTSVLNVIALFLISNY
jgi:hypothetical protein